MAPIEIKQGSVEEKVIRLLQKVYPITIEEISSKLKIRRDKLDIAISRLESQGIVQLEPLPDKTFVRLSRGDILFLGRNPTQKKRYKHKGTKAKKKEFDDAGYA